MTKISRLILVLTGVLSLSVYIPKLYWVMFDKPNSTPKIYYSCIIDDFVMFNYATDEFKDSKGNQYSRSEYEKLLPLLYYRQLVIDENMPDSIRGEAVDIHKFMQHRSYIRIRPSDIDRPQTKLYPLFESNSGRAKIELPNDVFRITWRIEFIDAASNTVNETKSRQFSAALFHQGFTFPAKFTAGIPNTRKSCDEGYFILDNDNKLFHLKMIKGEPYVKAITVPENITITFIECVDFNDKKYYAYLISQDNQLYTITQDDYKLQHWPIDNYQALEHELSITGNYFNYTLALKSDSNIQCYGLNKDYQVIDTYQQSWTPNKEKLVGKIADILFPFSIQLKDNKSRYIKLDITRSKSYYWTALNLLLMLVQVLIIKRKKHKYNEHIIDLVLIFFTGIFALISINLFPQIYHKKVAKK